MSTVGRSALFAIALALASPSSFAAKPARACIDAHAAGQIDRDAGHLLRARESFAACSSETCPAVIRAECGELSRALEPLIPSIVLLARDSGGQLLPVAQARMDGTRNLPLAAGTPFETDPGPHRIELTLKDGRATALNVTLAAAEKSRHVVATFRAPSALTPAANGRRRLAYVMGGVGLAALGSWAAFAWDGQHRQSQLEMCAPRCANRSEVDAMRRSYLIADILLGISAATLGTSAYLFISDGVGSDQSGRTLLLGTSGRF